MKESEHRIYDISQEVFHCVVFPGDPKPECRVLNTMESGDLYNLTAFSMCAHNGTHIDAPRHFLRDGATVDQIPLHKTVGFCYVTEHRGEFGADHAREVLARAASACPAAAEKILIKGDAYVSEAAAEVFAAAGVDLVGNESQTVGPENAPMKVHLILLSAEVVLLEGIRLGDVPEGVYWLHAAPICLGNAEGAPCRATLTDIT